MESEAVSTILVPIDGSKNSLKALDYASNLAKGMKSSVFLLYVLDRCDDDNRLLERYEGTSHVGKDIEALPDYRAIDKARGILQEASEVAEGHGITPEHIIAVGDVPDTIVNVATTYKFGMIVMGTRGHSTYRNKLMGHVSEIVAEQAPCPVLLAR